MLHSLFTFDGQIDVPDVTYFASLYIILEAFCFWMIQAQRTHKAPSILSQLKVISNLRDLGKGRRVHEDVIQSGEDSNVYVASALVNMYAKCGCMKDAQDVFEKIRYPDVVAWTALISGYAENGQGVVALRHFTEMRCEGCQPNDRAFLAAIRASTDIAVKEIQNEKPANKERGKQLQILTLRAGCSCNIFLESALLDMYAKCGDMDHAFEVFRNMRDHDVVSWNALISGFAENGKGHKALELFVEMKSENCVPDARTFMASFKACSLSGAEALATGKALHLMALRVGVYPDVYVKGALVSMYANCGDMKNALAVFDTMQSRDSVPWTALILGYADNGEGAVALYMFCKMRLEGCEPDTRTIVAAIKACTDLGEKDLRYEKAGQTGKALQMLSLKCGHCSNIYVDSTLLDLYAKCGVLKDARFIFEKMPYRDTVSWNAVIMGYAENGEGLTALDLFSRMAGERYTPNSRTYVAALKACTDLASNEEGVYKVESLEIGKELHLLISISGCDSDLFVGNTLVDMYSKCGSVENAVNVFKQLHYPDIVSWNALILGYADNGEGAVALDLFSRMRRERCVPDVFTFAAVLKACGVLGALEFGRAIYAELCRDGLENDTILATCLVDFYAKCASLGEARQAFELHATKDLVGWNALMAGYSRHGDTTAVFDLFEGMLDTGVQPDAVTFLSLLTACNHAGLVEKGTECFKSISAKYGVQYWVEHYTCMVDMLGRSNKLEDAMVLLRGTSPNAVIWTTVLGACRKWKNVRLGELAFESSVSLEDKNSAPYVLMANIYGSKGMWKEQAAVQAIRRKLKVFKIPGQSWWTSEGGAVHKFMAGDRSHPQALEINDKLKNIVVQMKEQGYVADLSSVVSDIAEAEKENALCGHSERLAIACALINTKEREPIRIMKNLRVCDDCHTVTAMISKIEERTILCRDANRFHVFKDGKCSCGDFW